MTRPMDDTTSLMVEIRRALKQLYDPVYLQRSPLVALLSGRAVPPGQEARMLRQVLVEAVEQLAPPASVPLRSETRRAYEALRGRYIEGLSIEELARQSNLSERQVRRDLRLALEALARIIEGLLEQAEAFREQAPAEGEAPIRQALETLGGDQAINLCEEVRNVQALLKNLADQMEVKLLECGLPESLIVRANRVVLRQVLVSLYTRMMEKASGKVISARASQGEGQRVILELHGVCHADERIGTDFLYPDLLQALDAKIQALQQGETLTYCLSLPAFPPLTLLLVDDNPSLHQLFRRYLTGLPYVLLSAYTASEGYRLACQQKPRLILLDIMMPQRDGWEMLRLLRENENTRSIPVVICSVLAEESLARSLSAAAYLRKPVSQSHLLETLAALLPIHPS